MKIAFVSIALALVCGCANYSWKSDIPQDMRSVAVPVFRNESDTTQLGSVVTRQILRELEREGTYKIMRPGEAALEIQGVIKESHSGAVAYGRKTGERNREYRLKATAVVSFIDKTSGKILVDNRKYHASAAFIANDDKLTGSRDASGRLAEDLARQIVDDATSLVFD